MSTKIIEIEVTCCKLCPFSEKVLYKSSKWVFNCLAPIEIHKFKYNIARYYEKETSPNWCPLKNKLLAIKHK